jgi:hypothetical protein
MGVIPRVTPATFSLKVYNKLPTGEVNEGLKQGQLVWSDRHVKLDVDDCDDVESGSTS